ncbi:DUF1538 domain-containing protein [Enterococcus pseudoavium]|mgnify:CR=1 FL=1|uniref:DUF1538 domain-containing protein n=1 Tax=Enterococcus pseudoavium TaxID=44007 RepID=A0AAE4I262_9ENTE|nr:DUF1538 domain-containing protein [Enterococcus pseudoavium]MDT2736391.1 DUF1538 domain-containing protein [Enterococcus pseudoavium]MDT2755486.1 DUF1538 domain-containing protein [Enterococcus pseudoavium]MDT2771733.1 DUF1538 domain-containing protein [Enterococcus pseudoavium]
MNQKLKENISESLSSVLPITLIVLIISVVLVPMEIGTIAMFLVGAVMLIIGMGFFQLGAEISMTPLGEGIGAQLSKSKKTGILALIVFVIGAIITIAEPDLQVLADQMPAIPSNLLVWTVAIGVGLCLTLAVLRILFKISLSFILMILYFAVILLSFRTPNDFVPVAFDSGGATTGPITVPFILALGVGLASVRSDKDATDDSFGLVAISSIGPILAVLLLGIFFRPTDTAYTPPEFLDVVTTRDVVHEFMLALPHYAYEVLISVLPIAALFFVFQLISRRYHRRQYVRMIVGLFYTYLGLVLFLTGVSIGFAPVGSLLGGELAASPFKWLLVPIGMLIGYFIVKAEPAIQVLNHQVETVTGDAISASAMNLCLSIGVAVSVGLAMTRAITGISIYWIIIPGYLIALLLTKFVPKIFIGIAFDSGGVASGPMTSTFLLPLCIGVSEALDGNIMADAFGVVALVALTPLIAVQIMGLIYRWKAAKAARNIDVSIEELNEIEEWEDSEDDT